jgi:hypothetical protein
MTRLDSEERAIGIEDLARLAHRGEARPLAATPQFLCDKGSGVPRRERMHAPPERVRVRLAALPSSGSIEYPPPPAVL